MDFTLSEDQQALRDSARTLLAREAPISLAQARYSSVDTPVPAQLWQHVVQSGWLELPIIERCLVLEEVGRVLAPVPLWETAGLLIPLLEHGGATDELARVTSSGATGTVALAGAFTPEAQAVDLIGAYADGAVVVTPREEAGVTAYDSLDRTRVLCEVAVPSSALPAPVVEEATVALAAEMLGTSRWILDTTVDYAKVRQQFGVPIGSFQAVKHKLADMLVDWERAWAAVYYAAMCVAADDADRTRAVSVAKATTNDAARHIAKDGIQLHGGIGFTWEHPLHLYIRRLYADEPLMGSSAQHLAHLADLLLPA